jgi:hypothetical protein
MREIFEDIEESMRHTVKQGVSMMESDRVARIKRLIERSYERTAQAKGFAGGELAKMAR